MPVLTPNSMLFGQPNQIPEEEPTNVENCDIRKRAMYLRKWKDVLWKRWTIQHLKALRERHNLNHQTKKATLKEEDVMPIKGEGRNRGKWKIGVEERLIQGRDRMIRGAQLKAGKILIEIPLQLLYPLELTCNRPERKRGETLRADAKEFQPRV